MASEANPMSSNPDQQTRAQLSKAIESALPRPHHHTLLAALGAVFPHAEFQYVLSKGGWNRMGGVLDAAGQCLGHNLEEWVNTELRNCGDDFEQFLTQYLEAGLLVTRQLGRTHYFVAAYGPAPEDFLQLEVEELQELVDRQLIDPMQPPQDRTELVEPINPAKVDAQAVGSSRYRFARLVDMRELLDRERTTRESLSPLLRLVSEWSQSRAAEQGHFCEHWLVANLDRFNSVAAHAFNPSLLSVHERTLKPFQWDLNKTGVELGNQLRDFDRAAGYPGAWYFHAVASKLVPESLAPTLQRDLDNGYRYLADKDLGLLQKLLAQPYQLPL